MGINLKRKHLFVLAGLLIMSIVFSVFQLTKASPAVPNPGHSLDQIEFPSGTILLLDTDCPSGWTRLTALDGKFLVAGSTYNPAVGGSDSLTLTEANLPSHTHGAGTLAADSAGAHTHAIAGTWQDTPTDTVIRVDSTIRNTSASTDSAGAHTHTISGSTGAIGSGTAFDNRPAFATIVVCRKN